MADIAAVFHWQPSEMAALSVEELIFFQRAAVNRWKAMNRRTEN